MNGMIRQFYSAVWNAREATCGGSPKRKDINIRLIEVALKVGYRLNVQSSWTKKLQDAEKIVKASKEYMDKLPADELLSEILNEISN